MEQPIGSLSALGNWMVLERLDSRRRIVKSFQDPSALDLVGTKNCVIEP